MKKLKEADWLVVGWLKMHPIGGCMMEVEIWNLIIVLNDLGLCLLQ